VNRLAFALLAVVAGCGYESSQLQLRTTIDAQQDLLDRCYQQALATAPDTAGTMTMLVRVPRGSGQIESIGIDPSSQVSNKQLQRCIQHALVGIPIGTVPIQDDLNVAYTFQFEPRT